MSTGWNGRPARRLSAQAIRRDGGRCAYCHGPGADTADHIIPRSKGGPDTLDNLQAAHRVCNSRRGTRPLSGAPRGNRPSREW